MGKLENLSSGGVQPGDLVDTIEWVLLDSESEPTTNDDTTENCTQIQDYHDAGLYVEMEYNPSTNITTTYPKGP